MAEKGTVKGSRQIVVETTRGRGEEGAGAEHDMHYRKPFKNSYNCQGFQKRRRRVQLGS
jgi:hypothetical protein